MSLCRDAHALIAMPLQQLTITNFRNLCTVSFYPIDKINIFYGVNGSGKTSIIEAIYYLSHNRSFRSHCNHRIINHKADSFQLVAKVAGSSIGIEKSSNKNSKLKINGKEVLTIADITKQLPIQLVDTESYNLLDGGPEFRRQFLDWGVFYVEHSFWEHWKICQKIIKQRNAALKARLANNEIRVWDEQLALHAEQINRHRNSYFSQLTPVLQENIADLSTFREIRLNYYSGWDSHKPYYRVLQESFNQDKKFGYTTHGPHRADIQIKINKVLAKDILSRGQKKLFVAAMKIAQAKLLKITNELKTLILVDDLSSELDKEKQCQLVSMIINLGLQTFITNIEPDYLKNVFTSQQIKMFHVEQGCVTTDY